jgi:glucuronosyltransferase
MLTALVANVYIGDSEAERILAVFSFNGKSHFGMFEALLKGLVARGHQVYVVGRFPQKKPIPNYTDISVEGSFLTIINNFTIEFVREFGYIKLLNFMWTTNLEMCRIVLEHPNVQELINCDEKFDLIITQIYGPDC